MPLAPQAQAVLAQIPVLTDEVLLSLTPPLLRRFARDGVPTTQTRYHGMFHGFFSMGAMLDAGKRAVAEAAAAVKARL